MNNTKLT